ncbi:MAG: phytanoyl-CoA dioxygenase family protein [Pseudonocardiaceae bacterium]
MTRYEAVGNPAKILAKSTSQSTGEDGFRFISDHLTDIDTSIRVNGLESHVYELETAGYTIIENALASTDVETLTNVLLTLAGEDDGHTVDAQGGTHENRTQEVMLLLSRGGRPFEELVLHPVALLLITYLLGASCTISSVTGYVKGRGETALDVHSDTAYVPDPLPPYAQLANVNYCLTDYTEADGCLTIVPGSHRSCHRPRGGEGAQEAIPIEAPAGAAIVFHGNTWHGAKPRRNPGLRLTLSTLYCRMYMRPQERYEAILSSDVLDRNPSRFGELIGRDVPTGWRSTDEGRRIVSLRKENAGRYYRTRGPHA